MKLEKVLGIVKQIYRNPNKNKIDFLIKLYPSAKINQQISINPKFNLNQTKNFNKKNTTNFNNFLLILPIFN